MTDYVTAYIGAQLLGIPIHYVQDVFKPERISRVPLAAEEVVGVLNLRGRIVTMIDLRRRLRLPPLQAPARPITVHIELASESYGLLVDSVGEVVRLADKDQEQVPINLDKYFAAVAAGVHRLESKLMIVLDVGRVVGVGMRHVA